MDWAPNHQLSFPTGACFMVDVLTNFDAGDSTDSIEELSRQQEVKGKYVHLRTIINVVRDFSTLRRGNGRVLKSRQTTSFRHAIELVPRRCWTKRHSKRHSLHPDGGQSTVVPIYNDGACLGNGQPNPRAGWSFVFRPNQPNRTATVTGRLENQGPFRDPHDQTSNRAELRAVITALRFRHWTGEGQNNMSFDGVTAQRTVSRWRIARTGSLSS
ncbi:rnase h domain protein [Fusarium beomiforme]|uniref:Rnase h domain protein n=1 Tax=Fusarium beomiforme TaxID=44412 RepID=A0A9P5ACF9_9HYPO|nr:rnase h domain protein [Fusarium beomiforme]